MTVAFCRVLKASTFASTPPMAVNASAITASMVAAFERRPTQQATDLVYRWGVVPQGTGKPYDVPRATFYDIDANAATCATFRHSTVRTATLSITWGPSCSCPYHHES
jgi:hypothetical protein